MTAGAHELAKEIEDLRVFMQEHCFRYGPFTLSSGRESKYYYDGKSATLLPSKQRLIGRIFVDVILGCGADALGGLAIGAMPIADAVGQAALEHERDLPLFVVRQDRKEHGTRDLVAQSYYNGVGLLGKDRRIAIVDDVITTGGSVKKAIEAVEALGCRVTLVAVLVERHEGGGDALRSGGYDVVSLFRTDEEGRLSVNEAFVTKLEEAQAKVG